MISKRLQKAINLMMRRGGQVIMRTRLDGVHIGHDWSEFLSKKHWPEDTKFHFSPWSGSMFQQALEEKLIRRDWEYPPDDDEEAYVLTDRGFLLAEQD